MRTRMLLVGGVVALAALHSTNLEAQKNTLPKGRPFQLLRDAVNQSQVTLLQQIESLQAQLDSNTANDQTQSQLIAAMQTLVSQMETSLSATQASISALTAYNALQDQLIEQQLAQVAALQASMTAMADLSELYDLYQAQQSALTTLTLQINFLTSQGQTQQTDLASLTAQLNALKIEYGQTSARLASGCPPNSSIRQLSSTTVVCETDSGALLQGAEFVGSSVTIPPGVTTTADAFCGPTSPAYIASGGGLSSTASVTLVQSVRLLTNGWRVMVQNPNAFSVQVQARVSCMRVN